MWRRAAPAIAISAFLALAAVGCGGGASIAQKTVTVGVRAPVQNLVLAHRTPEGPQIEPGEHIQSASGCSQVGGGRVKTIYVWPDAEHCIRVTPDDRLLFVNFTGTGPERREANEVVITLGGYEARVGPGQSAFFPAPAGSYLARGLHRTNTHADAPAPSVMVLPDGCAIPNHGLGRGASLQPGEGLCFVEGAPHCPGSKLRVRVARAGLAAGTVYQDFEIVNHSGRACTVSGFPDLFAVDAHGRSIGPPAQRDPLLSTMSGDHPRVIVLDPGGIATFEMNYGEAANYSPDCGPRMSAALLVTLPDGESSYRVPYRFERCRRQGFSVGRIE
jgi:hypothetical protein